MRAYGRGMMSEDYLLCATDVPFPHFFSVFDIPLPLPTKVSLYAVVFLCYDNLFQ